MPKWTKPSESLPEDERQMECGDRVVIIVAERPRPTAKIKHRLVIIEATETGWKCDEDLFDGYTPHDGVLWSFEDDVTAIANVLVQPGDDEP